jgi:hypothetical protein
MTERPGLHFVSVPNEPIVTYSGEYIAKTRVHVWTENSDIKQVMDTFCYFLLAIEYQQGSIDDYIIDRAETIRRSDELAR